MVSAQKLVVLLREQNELVDNNPLYTEIEKAKANKIIEQNEQLANSLQEQIGKIKAYKKAISQLEEHYTDDAIKQYSSEIDKLKLNIESETTSLAKNKLALESIETAYDDATDKINEYEQAITDAQNTIKELSSPKLTGMQEYDDQKQAITENINKLNLEKHKLENITPANKKQERELEKQTEAIQEQIDALNKQKDLLQAQYEVKYNPQLYQLNKASQAALGENKEVTLDEALAQIRTLENEIAANKQNIEQAKTDFTTATGIAWGDYAAEIKSLNILIDDSQTQVDTLNTKLEDLNTTLTDLKTNGIKLTSEEAAAIPTTPTVNTTTEPFKSYDIANQNRYMTPTEITGYATGGIAMTPQMAMVAESGPEAIMPLDKLLNISREITINVPVMLDGYQIAQATGKYQDNDWRLNQ